MRAAAAALTLGVVLLAGACGGWPCRFGGGAEFVSLGRNPYAAAQPTPVGRRLHALAGWRGEMYTGYGDYDENNGPVEVSAYSPDLASFSSKLRFPSESIELFRAIGARLYAPAIDPRGDGPSAAVAVGEPDGSWHNNRSIHMTHAFDIATLDGADLWLVGSRNVNAVVVRSVDGGRSWATALQVGPRSGHAQDFARFHFVFVHAGRLYVQAQDFQGGMFPRSQVWNGAAWGDGPDLRPIRSVGSRPAAFLGQIVYLGERSLMAFDGRQAREARRATARVVDLVVAGGALHVLDGQDVVATADLARWTPVATAPAKATSIGILDGFLYVGTEDAELFRYCRRLGP